MARTLTAGMVTAIAAKEGYADLWLLEITSSASTLRFCDKPQDVSALSLTWSGIGGIMQFSPPQETTDISAQSMRLVVSGVSPVVVQHLLANHVRGRAAKLYWGQITVATGVVVADPLLVFGALQNDPWVIRHDQQGSNPGTVTVETTLVTRLARHLHARPLLTNVASHKAFLDRAGLSTTDSLLSRVSTLANKEIYWGTTSPTTLQGGRGGRGTGSTRTRYAE